MHASTPSSAELIEQLTRQPIFQRVFEEDLKRQPFFESQDFNRMPVVPRQRVSEKLLENRLRRIEINTRKQQEVDSLIERKKLKEREIFTNMRNRLEKANEKKQENLRQSYSQQENRRRGEELQSREKLRRFQANLEKIEKGREKVEQQKAEYIFRIHRRTEENLKKAKEKRKLLQSVQDAENDQIHLEQWNAYRDKLARKYEGKEKSAPDHLYQAFKLRNQKLKSIVSEVVEQDFHQKVDERNAEASQNAIVSSSSAKLLSYKPKKIEYFGIYGEDMITKTTKDIQKMRKFLRNEGDLATQNEEAYNKFKQFFFSEIFSK